MRQRIAFVALLTLLIPAGAHAQSADVISIEEVPGDIARVIDDYAKAFVEHDAELMRSVVGGKLASSEPRSLANAVDVPFTRFEIDPVTQYSGDLASPRIVAGYKGADEVATYHVIERTQIGDETGVFQEDGAYTFTREPGREGYGGWRLVSKSDLDVLGFFSPVHLWDIERVSVLRSTRFLLLTHPSTADSMRPVLDIAERAYDRVDDYWPGPQSDRYVIIVPSTTAELGRILHETLDLEKFVAFVGAGADRTKGWEPTGPRLFVHLSHLDNYGPADQTEILNHELIHAITREVSGPMVPTWIEEGLANHAAGAALGNVGTSDTFPSNDRFVTGSVRDIQATYAQAQVAIATLEAEKGRDELTEFYADLGSRRVAPGTDEYHVRDAIAKSVGWSFESWVGAWRKRLD
jgi:hypothetical protein